MDTDEALRREVMANWDDRPASPDLGRITFRPGEGGSMPKLWAEYMLNLWWSAWDSKLTFATAVKQATVHFMVGDQP